MWSMGRKLNANEYHFGGSYMGPYDNTWIEDAVYAELAAAADALYGSQTNALLDRESMIDRYVEEHGTEEASKMLDEIFSRKH